MKMNQKNVWDSIEYRFAIFPKWRASYEGKLGRKSEMYCKCFWLVWIHQQVVEFATSKFSIIPRDAYILKIPPLFKSSHFRYVFVKNWSRHSRTVRIYLFDRNLRPSYTQNSRHFFSALLIFAPTSAKSHRLCNYTGQSTRACFQ